MLHVTQIDDYKALGKAIRLANESLEVIVTLDVGPRVMHFSLPSGQNVFEDEASLSEKLPDGSVWRILGGHRLWHSPESYPRSYAHDSEPLESYELLDNGILMTQKPEPWVQMQKQMEVRLLDQSVCVVNRIRNLGAWPVQMAVWSLTVGSRDGLEVCPITQRNTGLLPNTHYVCWPYSSLNDRRAHWGQKYVIVENDRNDQTAFKFGYPNEHGWIAYFNKGLCFIKKFPFLRGAEYPDKGCNWETYTSYWGVELESLSPLQTVQPGKTLEHTDEWFLFAEVEKPLPDDASVENALLPLAQRAGIQLPQPGGAAWDPTFTGE